MGWGASDAAMEPFWRSVFFLRRTQILVNKFLCEIGRGRDEKKRRHMLFSSARRQKGKPRAHAGAYDDDGVGRMVLQNI